MLINMLITDLAKKLTPEDIEEIRSLWSRKYYKEEQEKILDIFERYIGDVISRGCGKCRSEWIDKMRKVLNILDND